MFLFVPGSADLDVWQFSETLTLDYLSGKVRRVSKHLKEAGVDIRGGAVSANYVRSLKEHIDEGKYALLLLDTLNPLKQAFFFAISFDCSGVPSLRSRDHI